MSEVTEHQNPVQEESSNTLSNKEVNGEADKLTTQQQPHSNASIMSASELPDIASTGTELTSQNSKDTGAVAEPKKDSVISEVTQTEDEEWIDILGNQQLMKKVIRVGGGLSTRPTPQSRVKVTAKGSLESGTVVDKEKTIVFTVGDGDVIQALDLAITLMETGEVCQVKTSPRFAYGAVGKQPDIPPNATLLYDVELVEVLGPVDYQTISQEELITAVDRKRVRGNELFQRQEYDRAVTSYQRGLQMLTAYTEEHAEGVNGTIQDMQIRCWNNVAAAQLKVEMYKEVLESCRQVLERDPDNVKALFRSGKVLSQKGEMDEAVKRLQKASSLKPEEKAIKQELQRAVQRRDQMLQKEKAMYKRMVEGKAPAKTTTAPSKTKSKQDGTNWGPLPYLTAALAVAAIGIGLAYFITQRH